MSQSKRGYIYRSSNKGNFEGLWLGGKSEWGWKMQRSLLKSLGNTKAEVYRELVVRSP